MIKNTKGFTLIEILIVVAIIAILASVVLVGLGPTQSLGRDARRVSDLHEVQNGLELAYNHDGKYPVVSSGDWPTLSSTLTGDNIGINAIPNDPSGSKNYQYGTDAAGTTYIVAALMENSEGGPWNSYSPPSNKSQLSGANSSVGDCLQTSKDYCVTL